MHATRAVRRLEITTVQSDPLDAIRPAREAMARPRLGTPRSGGERQALPMLAAARRSVINASTEAQQQAFSLVIAAPGPHPSPVPRPEARPDVNTAANLRVHATWDT